MRALIAAAAQAGAAIRRGVEVKSVTPGSPARVDFESAGKIESVTARLVVGADGRASAVRGWGNFAVQRDPDRLTITGALLEGGTGYRDDALYFMVNPSIAHGVFLAPQSGRRLRAYLISRSDAGLRLQGQECLPQFVQESIRCGVPAEFYADAKAAGPIASFKGADHWVEHPYSAKVSLIGDAAAASDPCWGQGMSLTLRDVRVLRDSLLADDDWDRAGHIYAGEHDRYYQAMHTSEDWLTSFFYDQGDQAEARRAHALPLIMSDPSRIPDHLFGGPDLPVDEGVRRRFFGLD